MNEAIQTIIGIQKEIYQESKRKGGSIEDQLIRALRAEAERPEEQISQAKIVKINKDEEFKQQQNQDAGDSDLIDSGKN